MDIELLAQIFGTHGGTFQVPARKGYLKLMNGLKVLYKIEYPVGAENSETGAQDAEMQKLLDDVFRGLNDDLNTARAIASLFNVLKKVNSMYLGQLPVTSLSAAMFEQLQTTYTTLVTEVLGLLEERPDNLEEMLNLLLRFYKDAKDTKDYGKVDEIRAEFKKLGMVIKDMKNGIDWAYEE